MKSDSLLRPLFQLLNERSGPPVIVIGVGLFLLLLARGIHTPIAWLESWLEVGKVALPAAMILSGIGGLMYDYLQRSRRRLRSFYSSAGDPQYSDVLREVKELSGSLRALKDIGLIVDAPEKKRLVDELVQSISKSFTDTFSVDLAKRLAEGSLQGTQLSEIMKQFKDMRERLLEEVEDLGRRANTSLVIGGMATAVSVLILGALAYLAPSRYEDWLQFAEHFGPRMSVAVFVQIFAYFFLRLYRHSIFEIKYFQNEITTIESRMIALEAGVASGDKATMKHMCAELIKTERNFILRKGETTISLRKDELEQQGDKIGLSLLAKVLSTRSGLKEKGS
jgi:hypothetical protein